MKTKKTPATFTDFVGKEIKIGDIVAYGKNLGRCASVNIGIVLETYSSQKFWDDNKPYGDPDPRIALLTNQDTWEDFAKRNPNKGKWDNKPMKRVSVQFPSRMIVISNPNDLGQSELADLFRAESLKLKE